MLFSQWARVTSDRFGFASTWSERHAAYASGLGTFGLSDGLITPRGQAMRCGSVVARIAVPPLACLPQAGLVCQTWSGRARRGS